MDELEVLGALAQAGLELLAALPPSTPGGQDDERRRR